METDQVRSKLFDQINEPSVAEMLYHGAGMETLECLRNVS